MLLWRYNYQAAYIDWGKTGNLSEAHIVDLSEETLCNYAASFMSREAGSTVRAKLAAVKNPSHDQGLWLAWWHSVARGAQWCRKSHSHLVLPVKAEWLNLLHDDLDNTGQGAFNSCVTACADLVFYGQLRLGEVLSHSPLTTNYNSSKLLLVRDLNIPHISDHKSSAKLRLPCTKTHQARGESVVLINHDIKSNAVRALSHHIKENNLSPGDPLFAY
ncbi:uncharacterized protein C8R40DRAFT_1071976 [Lentinula edodes]|uniref:uncharacterized protein n=1 Tax=Lentinula edodes TaxID=5353 RepID=UPI001E8EE79C|nr:uncharacterized protein C8R40DRAFT_1071976 [Lentinula edodes]KAH7872205.1 hypothetical protein C8R40DRAFT_1071976 [Lentinula edodes]